MKRRFGLITLPFVFALALFCVKWRADHPTPTKEDLEIRALMRQSSDVVLSNPPSGEIFSKRIDSYKVTLSKKEWARFIDDFRVSRPSVPVELMRFNSHRMWEIRCNIKNAKTRTILFHVDPDVKNGSVQLIPQRGRELNIHRLTVQRWMEILLSNPRIGPELQKRMK